MKKLTLSTFFILLSLTGCSEKKSDSASQAPAKEIKPEVVNLQGKSVSEVLALKYKSAVARCQLMSRIGATINGSNSLIPQSEVLLDLKSNLQLPIQLTLKSRPTIIVIDGRQITHEIMATVKIVDLQIRSLILEDVNEQTTYKMDNSLFLTVDFYAKSIEQPEQASKSETIASNQIVYERKKSNLLNDMMTFGAMYSTKDQLDCSIETEIYEDYKNDFQIFNEKKE